MTILIDVHENALETLLMMDRTELWDVLCSFEGTRNIIDNSNRGELLREAQIQVDRAYANVTSDEIKAKLFYINS